MAQISQRSAESICKGMSKRICGYVESKAKLMWAAKQRQLLMIWVGQVLCGASKSVDVALVEALCTDNLLNTLHC